MDFDSMRDGYMQEFKEAGHAPKLDEDGDIDWFGYDGGGIHNGLACISCDFAECMWCADRRKKTMKKCPAKH